MAGKAIKILVAIYLAWLALVVLVVTPAANVLAPRLVAEYLGRDLHTDAILFNPFTLAARVRGATLLEPDGDFFLSADELAVDLSLESLLGRGLVLDEVEVRELRVDLRRHADGRFNFSDLLPAGDAATAAEEDQPAELPALTIDRLHFQARRIDLTDENRDKPFTTHYDDLDIHVIGLTTTVHEGDPYRIDIDAGEGGELHWQGDVSLPESRGDGTLEISGLRLAPFWRFAEPWLDFRLTDGEVNLRGDYTLSWSGAFAVQVTDGEFELDGLALEPKDPAALADTGVALRALRIGGIAVDSAAQSAGVAEVLVDGLDVTGWSEGRRVSLAEMFAGAPDPNAATTPDSDSAAEPPAWTVTVDAVRVENGALGWRSAYTDPPLLTVAPISASVRSLHWPLQGEAPLELALRINDTTDFSLQGALEMAQGAGAIDYRLEGLPLAWFNPNLPAALHARITDGRVDVNGSLALADFAPLQVTMDGAVSDFSGRIVDSEETLTSWDSVRWQGLDVDLDGHRVALARLLVENYRGRVHIAPDGSINTSNVWREEFAGSEVEAAAEEMAKGPPWQVNVPEIHVSGSEIDFMDESLPIHFRTVIGNLEGQVTGIDSTPGAQADVDIRGTVDGYAPVTLAGSVAPFGDAPAIDLELDFSGVDMPLLSPYSGTYAGRAIERGLLSLELHYRLADNRLQGDNKVLIDQLKLGEKVASDKAVDLPLDLALALLTDANGVIDLQVPVEGDVGDPQFDISSVIGKAFLNLITKAVTAPFNLLASLVGSEEDLQRLPFPVGVTTVGPRTTEKLALLADALDQRPQLTLVIYGRLNLDADRKKLQEQGLEAQLREEGMADEDAASHGERFIDAVEKRYRALGEGDGEDLGYSRRYDRVLATVPVSDEQLLQLAQERAVAVKEHLVNTQGLDADRAVIERASKLDPEREVFSGVELDLDG